ncbi:MULTISPECIES: siderophore-interacting protein [unclassified Plantactinospora]|uniref:siderophore-interacting protein n=1 Tax=unclassified Plantactinospora TaxID=2631981 RepID=UPI000D157B35|nr:MULTISPECIES: siderophore-interacting protein [unclassified Plantactinospora]AVT33194.1 NADPH-dependent ferric siderophore reductase [Plantactinospora sp. BC1]AVT40759.1 NADPH-dependent ferric siderophore reductase [Plantactinospora sp. BB1]
MAESSNGTGVRYASVLRTAWLTPHMIRVVLGGEGLAGFAADTYTDHYVKLIFPPAGVDYPVPLDLDMVKRELPRDQWPRLRTYTVRAWDAVARELTLDFVYHGDEGLAGPWAAAARPGDRVMFRGPGGGYAPDPLADWHLLVGDESALPAIGAALERLPYAAPARVFLEVDGPAEEQHLGTEADAEIVWVHRAGRVVGEALVEAVRAATFPAGQPHAFVHGEAYFVRELRRMLRGELRVPKERLSISGYWRRGDDDESWRSAKPDWNRQVEAEESAVVVG